MTTLRLTLAVSLIYSHPDFHSPGSRSVLPSAEITGVMSNDY